MDKQKSFFHSYFAPSAWLFFIAVCFVYAVEAYVEQGLYNTPEVFHNSMKDSHSKEEINNQLLLHSETEWLTYVLIPVFILFQALMAGFCLNVGAVFYDLNLDFRVLFEIAMKAMGIFLIAHLFYIVMLLFVIDIKVFDDFSKINCLSLFALSGDNILPEWVNYILQAFNIFELGFVFLIAKGLQVVSSFNYMNALRFSFISYVLGFITFILIAILLKFCIENTKPQKRDLAINDFKSYLLSR